MNELPLWQLAMFIWPIQEETDTKNATLCVREKIKMGKVELSITVLNKILKLFVCINTILHQTFNPLCGPSIVQRHIYIFRINNTSRCFHIITFEYIIKEFSFCKNSTPPPLKAPPCTWGYHELIWTNLNLLYRLPNEVSTQVTVLMDNWSVRINF